MEIDGQLQPALVWEHNSKAANVVDQEGRIYPNMAEWVLHELWVSLAGTTFVNTSH